MFILVALALAPAKNSSGRIDTVESLVEEELVTGSRQQRRSRSLEANAHHSLVQLSQFVNERREVGVAGTDHKGGHVVALEYQLDGVDRHLDVGRILPHDTFPLRNLSIST